MINKDINQMTRAEFEQLPIIDDEVVVFDSLVFLPLQANHDSGYSLYNVVVCDCGKPLGKIDKYDTFSIYGAHDRLGIDVLAKSKLTRIFFRRAGYKLDPLFNSMKSLTQPIIKDEIQPFKNEIKDIIEFLEWGKEQLYNHSTNDAIACINQEISYIKRFLNRQG